MAQSFLHIVNLSQSRDKIVDLLKNKYGWQNQPTIFIGGIITVKELREFLVFCSKRPLDEKDIILVITKAENINKEVANTMLKILEEPPPYLYIHLVTSNEGQVITTITSRCHRIRHNDVSDSIMPIWQWDKMSKFEKLRWARDLSEDEEILDKLTCWLFNEKNKCNWETSRKIENLISQIQKSNANNRLILENFVLKNSKI